MGQPTHHQPLPSSYLSEGLYQESAHTINPDTSEDGSILVKSLNLDGRRREIEYDNGKHTSTQAHKHTDIHAHAPLQEAVSVPPDSCPFSYLKLLMFFYQECVHEKQIAHLQVSLGRSTSRDTHCAKMYFTNKSVQIT